MVLLLNYYLEYNTSKIGLYDSLEHWLQMEDTRLIIFHRYLVGLE